MVSVCDLPPAGGWLFYALYAANQQWWFLVICLSVWGFVLVALSFALSGREFLFPVALVTSFIGVWQTVTQLMLLLLHRCRRTLLVPLLSLECLASSLLVWCCQECTFNGNTSISTVPAQQCCQSCSRHVPKIVSHLVWSVLRTWLLCIVLLMVLAVVCNFDSVKQAMVMTLVKTVAFAGAIVLYTIISLVMFPLTATQQVGLGMCMHLLAAPTATAVSRPVCVLAPSSMLLLKLVLLTQGVRETVRSCTTTNPSAGGHGAELLLVLMHACSSCRRLLLRIPLLFCSAVPPPVCPLVWGAAAYQPCRSVEGYRASDRHRAGHRFNSRTGPCTAKQRSCFQL